MEFIISENLARKILEVLNAQNETESANELLESRRLQNMPNVTGINGICVGLPAGLPADRNDFIGWNAGGGVNSFRESLEK